MRTNNILAVTLARGGSKGVPHKHVRMLGNRPVLAWTIEAVPSTWSYCISSDDEDILDIARGYDIRAIRRPPGLALDTTPTLPALQHAIQTMENMFNRKYDVVVEVRATSPFKTQEDIEGAVDVLIEREADSVIGVTMLGDHHPMRAKWLDNGQIRDFIPEPESGRRQDCKPEAFIRNGTIYALRAPVERLFGHEKSYGYVMPWERSINIDTEYDWLMCEILARKGLK